MNVKPEGKINFNKHNNSWEKICVNCTPINSSILQTYEGWNFNSGNYLFTTDTE